MPRTGVHDHWNTQLIDERRLKIRTRPTTRQACGAYKERKFSMRTEAVSHGLYLSCRDKLFCVSGLQRQWPSAEFLEELLPTRKNDDLNAFSSHIENVKHTAHPPII